MPTFKPLKLNHRELALPKAVIAPELGSATVLTNEVWDFVELALVRQKKEEAKFYWQQAREFYSVAEGLPVRSAPLLLYYSYMNAAKALLVAKGVTFSPYHGVTKHTPTAGAKSKGLPAGIEIKADGVLPALSKYLGETEARKQHTIKDILFNLVYIHRTYSLTFTSQGEIFIPIVGPKFVFEEGTNNVFFSARLSTHNPPSKVAKRLPPSIKLDPSASDGTLLSTASVAVSSVRKPTGADLTAITGLAKSLREDLYYINGAQTLWYVKTVPKGTTRIQRQSTTLTLAAMHRLSELCRYTPMHMARYLEGQKNWLLSEFIRMSGSQFLDEIASEITGKNFMIPNVRPAS